ncbi:diguanylate cyclase domain-containing protein [Dactylosporangium sp. CA-092794]|uniref:diguanylate cyclase domain-containing protein n=1 Tax=Dactylosporangium sp. CA-092794 TaxID=3239929 RepID=UPI003D8D7D81
MAWAVAYLRRDLLRAVRLGFVFGLAAVTTAALIRIALLGLAPRVAVASFAVVLGMLALRVSEHVRVRPVPIWADALELAAFLPVVVQVADVDAVLGLVFFHVLFRSAVGDLRRLLLLAAGYITLWVTAALVEPRIPMYPGGMVSLVVTGLLVYSTRVLLLRLQEQHRSQNALLQAVLRRFPFPVLVTDPAGAVMLANPAALDLLGWPSRHATSPSSLGLTGVDASPSSLNLTGVDGVPADLRAVAAGAARELRLTRPDGTTSDVLVEAVPIEEGAGTVFALLDVSAQRIYEESLHHAAYHDPLTGLPNRALLWQHLNNATAAGRPYAVLLIDLDDFKTVNDTHGHQAGDDLLTGVAHRLRDAALAETRGTEQRAVVARLGGDEFAVLLPGADARSAQRLAAALRATFDQPFPTSGGRLAARGSVGLALAAAGQEPDEVLADADAAMYRAKPRRTAN